MEAALVALVKETANAVLALYDAEGFRPDANLYDVIDRLNSLVEARRAASTSRTSPATTKSSSGRSSRSSGRSASSTTRRSSRS